MASKVTTLFEDSAKTNALYPRTKTSAVSDGSGNGLDALLNGKQDTLISGTNIKTVGSESVLGSGNIVPFFSLDTTNILGTLSNNGTLTASDDGYVFIGMHNSNYGNARVYLNNVSVGFNENGNQFYAFPMKNGDVLKIENVATPLHCTLYGLK